MIITFDQMVERFGLQRLVSLTDRDGSGQVDAEVVAAKIADVNAVVSSYLAGRYALPLSPVPPVLTAVAATLVLYGLYDDHAPEKIAEDNKSALQFLREVRDGKNSLEAGTVAPAETSENLASFRRGAEAFPKNRLGVF